MNNDNKNWKLLAADVQRQNEDPYINASAYLWGYHTCWANILKPGWVFMA
jgi:hypothetical protein